MFRQTSPAFRLAPLMGAVLGGALLALPTALIASPARAQTPGGGLSVTVTGATPGKGTMMIAVFDEAGFKSEKPVAAEAVPVTGDSVTTRFGNLPPGRYGLKIFQDLDGNGRLKQGALGMPAEPWAFSNNAQPNFGPPSWKASAFDLGAEGAVHTVRLN